MLLASALLAEPLRAVLVVELALGGVGEDLVGLAQRLEGCLCLLAVVWVLVRVQL